MIRIPAAAKHARFLESARRDNDPLYGLWVLILALDLRRGERSARPRASPGSQRTVQAGEFILDSCNCTGDADRKIEILHAQVDMLLEGINALRPLIDQANDGLQNEIKEAEARVTG